jgi:hypothetical protein
MAGLVPAISFVEAQCLQRAPSKRGSVDAKPRKTKMRRL